MKSVAYRIGAAICLAALPALAAAQNYPSRPITFIVPFSVGTASDILSRTVGKQMGDRMGTSVVVDNRPGASGSIGNAMVAKAAPDGYTLLTTATSFIINKSLDPKLPYEPLKQYTPIALLCTGSMGLVVNPDIPANTIGELVALARSKPATLFYASPGNGTPPHLSMELFKLETRTDITHVPYKDQNGALTDIVAGRANVMITSPFGILPQIRAGKVRVLGMLRTERLPALPAVPTFTESGFPDLDVALWYGFLGPAGLPPEILARLGKETNAALAIPDVRNIIDKQGLESRGGSPEQFGEWMRKEQARWTRVVKEANIKAD